MKRLLLSSILVVIASVLLNAQVPEGFNYQAVARVGSELLPDANLIIRISIITSDDIPETLWIEEHDVNTNEYGLFSLIIGDPTASGTPGTINSFQEIDWTIEPYTIKIDLRHNSTWHDMGSSDLVSVPYAMLAKNAINIAEGSNLSVVGDDIQSDEALFEVRRSDGQLVFAVYNDGVQAFFDENVTKARTRGGFAVAGFDSDKGIVKEYMTLTKDSVRMYFNEPTMKNSRGGFAISSFDNDKEGASSLMNLSPDNYFIGHESGVNNTTGLYNTFLGYQSGFSNTIADAGIFLGYNSGYSNVNGYTNIFMGNYSGFSNTGGFENVFIGDSAGYSNLSGVTNVFIGASSGRSNIDGNLNVFIGDETGWSNTSGFRNTFVGTYSGWNNTTGHSNVFLGPLAGVYNESGQGNIFIGRSSGYNMKDGNDNIFMGKWSGINSTEGNNNIFLGTLSGRSFLSGADNIFIGSYAGFKSDTSHANVFIGYNSGYNDSITYGNVFLGNHAGVNHSEGDGNVIIGSSAGWENKTGAYNIFLGYDAGWSEDGSNKLYIENTGGNKDEALIYGEFDSDYLQFNATVNITGDLQLFGSSIFGGSRESSNTFVGDSIALNIVDRAWNSAFGSQAGYSITSGWGNVFFGTWSGGGNTIGNNNTFLGRTSGAFNIEGSQNTFVGASAGYNNESGSQNVAIGRKAGMNAKGDGNIFIGFESGYLETASERLFIENSRAGSDSTLIYGEFDNDRVRLNAKVNIRDFMVLEPQNEPANPEPGTIYFDATSKILRVYDGTGWRDLW